MDLKQIIRDRLSGRQWLSLLAIVVVAVGIAATNHNVKFWNQPMRVIQWDIKSYYAYLPAAFIYHDLSLDFIEEDPGFFHDKFWPLPTPTGGRSIVTSMGMAYLYFPFFWMGHFTAWVSGAEMTGYSPPYAFFLQFSSLFYLLLGLLVLRKILRRYFSDGLVALTLLALVFGTNLFWYASMEAPMSHAYSFALFASFMLLTQKWYRRPSVGVSICLGLLSGLIVLVRPTNVVILLFFIFWGIRNWQDLKERPWLLLKQGRLIGWMAVFAILVWVPQMIYWKQVAGQFLYFSYGDDAAFYFNNPRIWEGLFSYRKGWLLYTPLMALALAGIPLLRDRLKEWLWPVLLFTLLNIYVVLSWWSWWYGGGFGLRAFIESYALLSLPLAALIQAGCKLGKRWRRMTIGVVLLLGLHGLFQTVQYYYGAIHWDGMTRAAYWASFGRPKPLPGLAHLIERPDYNLARQGVDGVMRETPPPMRAADRVILCDADSLSADEMHLVSADGEYLFEGALLRSRRRAYQGAHSLRLNRSQPYGFTIRVAVQEGEEWLVSVMRKSIWHSGQLVVAARDANSFYQATQLGPPASIHGWDSLSLHLTIPALAQDSIVVYTHNPSLLPAYFDRLMIQRIKTNRE